MIEIQNINDPVADEDLYPVLYGYGNTYCKTVEEIAEHIVACSKDREPKQFSLATYEYVGIYEGRIDVISQQPIGRMKRYITATGENTYDSFCSRNKEWRQNLGCLEELYKAFHHHYGIVMDDDVFTEAKERQHKVKIVCNSFKN